jgi:hypothetical protein
MSFGSDRIRIPVTHAGKQDSRLTKTAEDIECYFRQGKPHQISGEIFIEGRLSLMVGQVPMRLQLCTANRVDLCP